MHTSRTWVLNIRIFENQSTLISIHSLCSGSIEWAIVRFWRMRWTGTEGPVTWEAPWGGKWESKSIWFCTSAATLKTGSSIYLQVFQFNLRIHAATQILSQGTQRWHWVSRWYWWWWWFAWWWWWWYVMMTMTFSEFVIMLIYDGFKLWHIQDM